RAACVNFSASASSSSLRVSSTLPRTNSLICPLIISSLNCTMLLDMVCRLLSNVCVLTSFYQRPASRVYFFAFFNLRNLLYIIPSALGFLYPAKFQNAQFQRLHKHLSRLTGRPRL